MSITLNTNEPYEFCDPNIYPFHAANDLPDLKETIGQERAFHSLDFWLSLDSTGCNIFLLGGQEQGK